MDTKYPEFPIVTDTEAETSVDVEKSLENLDVIAEKSTKKRRSLFNLTVEVDTQTAVRQSNEFKSVEERVRKEIRDWSELYRTLRSELKTAKEKHPIIDITILPEEKRNFLIEPDMDHYIRTMHEFQCNAMKFLEIDFIGMMETRQNIEKLCKQKINLAKVSKLRELQKFDGY